jgi:hypothetical protein
VKPNLTTDYRLQSGGFRSGVVRISVAPLVELSAGSDGVTVNGQERPAVSGGQVQVQRLDGANWVSVATTTTDANGSFAAALDLAPGSYRARVTVGRGFVAGISQTLVVVAP